MTYTLDRLKWHSDLETSGGGIGMGLLDSVIASVLKGTMNDQQSQALPAALSQILGGCASRISYPRGVVMKP